MEAKIEKWKTVATKLEKRFTMLQKTFQELQQNIVVESKGENQKQPQKGTKNSLNKLYNMLFKIKRKTSKLEIYA